MTLQKAYFAGGCFWCMEAPFEKTEGVTSVDSGYVNSKIQNPKSHLRNGLGRQHGCLRSH